LSTSPGQLSTMPRQLSALPHELSALKPPADCRLQFAFCNLQWRLPTALLDGHREAPGGASPISFWSLPPVRPALGGFRSRLNTLLTPLSPHPVFGLRAPNSALPPALSPHEERKSSVRSVRQGRNPLKPLTLCLHACIARIVSERPHQRGQRPQNVDDAPKMAHLGTN
jgi:hypothetical protein